MYNQTHIYMYLVSITASTIEAVDLCSPDSDEEVKVTIFSIESDKVLEQNHGVIKC